MKSALKSEEAQAESSAEDTSEADMTEAKINTTNEELEAFMIIKSICREKLMYRDCSIEMPKTIFQYYLMTIIESIYVECILTHQINT